MSLAMTNTAAIAAPAVASATASKAVAQGPMGKPAQFSFSRSVALPMTTRQTALNAVRRTANVAVVAGTWAPPTVSDTKSKLLELYPKPIPNMYNVVLQELLVQHHFVRYNIDYKYDPIFALGICSVYDQVLGGEDSGIDSEAVFSAFITSLDEDPKKYRKDAAELEAAVEAAGVAGLVADASAGAVGKTLADVAALSSAGNFYYSRFFAVGLFRMLELAGATDPTALDNLVSAVGVPKAKVTADLATYKGVLSRLNAAKELMADFLAREKKVQAAREAEKAAAAAKADA